MTLQMSLHDAIDKATLVAWDGCHKIYVSLDKAETSFYRDNYDFWLQGSPQAMLNAVLGWWENSCQLRFITATTSGGDWYDIAPMFTTLTPTNQP